MDDRQNLIAKLHPLERQILPVLQTVQELKAITAKAKLSEVEAMRAIQWLENKNILTIQTEKKKVLHLEKNGLIYKKDGLPEKRFLKALDATFKTLPVVTKKAHLSREEATACLGLLKRKNAIIISQENGLSIKITDDGQKLLHQEWPEKHF